MKGGAHDQQMIVDIDNVVSPRAALGGMLSLFGIAGGFYWFLSREDHESKNPAVCFRL